MRPEIGMMLYGYCNGWFGRDSYDDKRIEAIGDDWIVVRCPEPDAEPEFAQFDNKEQRDRLTAEWNRNR